jgi:hypothetical protein
MRLAFVPASRRHELTSLRTAVLTKEMHQYQHATTETIVVKNTSVAPSDP